jgi:hypothetical protein
MTDRMVKKRSESLEKTNVFLNAFDSKTEQKKSLLVNALMIKLRKSILVNKEELEQKMGMLT